MKRKIIFKNYKKLLLLILILVATLIFGFINGSSNVIEGLTRLYTKPPRDNKATENKHKDAANKRSKGDGDISNKENNLYDVNAKLNND